MDVDIKTRTVNFSDEEIAKLRYLVAEEYAYDLKQCHGPGTQGFSISDISVGVAGMIFLGEDKKPLYLAPKTNFMNQPLE